MTSRRTYLVPVDFSKGSMVALNHAVEIARRKKGEVLLVHVVTDSGSSVPVALRGKYFDELERGARQRLEALPSRGKLPRRSYRFALLQGANAARLIAEEARKSKASMIIMGSHGRTGLPRLMVGSVAEKTVRYAECPVLVVKD